MSDNNTDNNETTETSQSTESTQLPWISPEEAARLLGVHRSVVYAYCRKGRLDAHKFGREWRIRREPVERYLTTGNLDDLEPSRAATEAQ